MFYLVVSKSWRNVERRIAFRRNVSFVSNDDLKNVADFRCRRKNVETRDILLDDALPNAGVDFGQRAQSNGALVFVVVADYYQPFKVTKMADEKARQ